MNRPLLPAVRHWTGTNLPTALRFV